MGHQRANGNIFLSKLRKLGCVAYYNMAMLKDTTTPGAAVSSVTNLVYPGLKTLTQGGSLRPVNSASPVALDFDGSDDRMTAVAFTALSQPTTHIIIFKPDVLPGATEQYLVESNSTANRQTTWINSTDNLIKSYAGTTLSSGIAISDTNWHVYCVVYNGASSTTRVDGVAGNTGAAGANTFDSICLGTYYTGGSALQHFNGKIGAYLLFSGALSVANQDFIARCLKPQFGFSMPMETLASDNFETGTYGTFWTEAYTEPAKYFPNTAEYQVQSTVKHSGTYALNYYLPVGSTTDSQPIKLSLWPDADPAKDIYTLLGHLREIYVEWYEFFTTGYPWPNSGHKILQLGYFDANEPGTPIGDTSQNWEMIFQIRGYLTDGNYYQQADFLNAAAVGSVYSLKTAEPDGPPSRAENVWKKCGFHLKLNSAAGVEDGLMRFYLDDVEILTMWAVPWNYGKATNAIPLCDAGVVDHPINSLSIGLNWSNPMGTAASAGHRYIDDIKIYATKP